MPPIGWLDNIAVSIIVWLEIIGAIIEWIAGGYLIDDFLIHTMAAAGP